MTHGRRKRIQEEKSMNFLSRLFGQPSAGRPLLQPQEYKDRFMDSKQPHTLVDVRNADEFRGGHIPGAINIAVHELNNSILAVSNRRVVLE